MTTRKELIMRRVLGVVVMAVAAVAPATGAADPTVQFNLIAPSPGGNLLISSTTYQGIGIDAFYRDPSTSAHLFIPTNIFVRNEGPHDVGLGVCSPGEIHCGAVGIFTGHGGDSNELSNEDQSHRELIRLTLPEGDTWTHVYISSLDCNGDPSCGTSAEPERGRLFYGSSADPNASRTLFTSFTGSNSALDDYALTGAAASAKYLFFLPGDGTTGNNDYLVRGVDVVDPVPEPGTLLLLGSGLSGVGFLMRRRRARKVAILRP
jgi:hypothetical protein